MDSLVFTILHQPNLKEWVVKANEIQPCDIRFYDECSRKSGAPGLVGAISHCFRTSMGKPSLLIIETRGNQYRLRFHSEETQIARFVAG